MLFPEKVEKSVKLFELLLKTIFNHSRPALVNLTMSNRLELHSTHDFVISLRKKRNRKACKRLLFTETDNNTAERVAEGGTESRAADGASTRSARR